MSNYSTYGKEIQADLWGVDFSLLDNLPFLRNKSKLAVAKAKATYISHTEKQFKPNGVTLLILLEESHFAIHTYPEQGFAAASVYTCGNVCQPEIAIDYMIEILSPKEVYKKETVRGVR